MIGCGQYNATPTPNHTKIPPPKWVYSIPPTDTDMYLYGQGIGKNREDAIKKALNDMLSKLSISVESTFKSKEKVENRYYSSTVTSEIKASVKKIKINNYKVVKSYKISYREFAVLIEVDRRKLFNGLSLDIENKESAIRKKLLDMDSKDRITQYNIAIKMLHKTKELESLLAVMKTLNPSFNIQKHRAFIARVERIYEEVSKNLSFNIRGSAKSKVFVEKIKNFLAQKGFRLSKNSENAVNVIVNVKDNLVHQGIKIVVFDISVIVYDKGVRIGGNNITIKERYNGSQSSIYRIASLHFEDDIKDEGINKVLGITLELEKN